MVAERFSMTAADAVRLTHRVRDRLLKVGQLLTTHRGLALHNRGADNPVNRTGVPEQGHHVIEMSTGRVLRVDVDVVELATELGLVTDPAALGLVAIASLAPPGVLRARLQTACAARELPALTFGRAFWVRPENYREWRLRQWW